MAAGDDRAIVAGRYALHRRIASGGMASVYYGRLFGAEGFSRVVAIKRLHPQYATDGLFRAALIDEARLVSRIRHPNVVPVLDVVSDGDELLVVMEYVHGEKLSTLLRISRESRQKVPLPVVSALLSDTLRGLHAAHEATNTKGELLGIVHRDVSPQNVLVSADGSALVTDFGIAKAVGRSQTTNEGQIKGKLAYMAYEQLSGGQVTRRTDVGAAAIVLWEALTLRRLFGGDSEGEVYAKLMQHDVGPPSRFAAEVPRELDALVLRGLDRNPERRFATALDMAEQLERIVPPAPRSETARWLKSVAGHILEERARDIEAVEQIDVTVAAPSSPVQLPPAEPPAAAVSGELSKGTWNLASRPRSRTPLVGLSLLGIVVAGLALWFFVLRHQTPGDAPAIAPVQSLAPAVAPPVASSAEPTPPAPSAAPAPSVSAKPPVSAARPPPPKRAPATKSSAGCRVLGADGIWRIRPGCL